jgi:hypothetical protein
MGDRETWLLVRRALLSVVAIFDRKYGVKGKDDLVQFHVVQVDTGGER